VGLAVENVSLLGRDSAWWAWIVLNTPFDEYAKRRLAELVARQDITQSTRSEALNLLWQKTREQRYLEHWFLAVEEPGRVIVGIARDQLLMALPDTAHWKAIAFLKVPASKPLPIDVAEFRRVLAGEDVTPKGWEDRDWEQGVWRTRKPEEQGTKTPATRQAQRP
jgi:hypothetical protein